MKGAVALLIPGNMCDARMWRGGGDVIRNRLRGALGAEPIDVDTFHDATIAKMAERALASAHGPLLPIGFSMGAIIAVEMAIQAPERVKGLILAGYNAAADLPERAALRLLQQAKVKGGHLASILIDELKPNYLATSKHGDEELRTLLFDMGMTCGPEVFIFQSEALRLRLSRVEALSHVGIPVLYLTGAEDALCPPDWHRRWKSLTPGSKFVEVEAAGHMAPLEQPHLFAGAIDRWAELITGRLAA
jgi:pimeloyl-ACP methyl ester carboxylesterase